MKKITTIIAALLFNLTIAAQTTLTTDSVTQLSTCGGGNIIVTFKTTGTFPLGNKFIAQISNGLGQFTNPVNIGQMSFNLGFILTTLPTNLTLGLYKIRVITTNPADTSVSPNSLFITGSIALLNKIVTGCLNGSTTLSALLPTASSYKWSTGATTQLITLTNPGTYTLTTTDILGCKTIVMDTVVGTIACNNTGTGIDENTLNNIFTVYPNPSNGFCNVAITNTNSKDVLITVMDILGKEVFRLSEINSSGEYKKEINLEHLATGIYSIKLIIGTDVKTRKLIIR